MIHQVVNIYEIYNPPYPPVFVDLGNVGENGSRCIDFLVTGWLNEYPTATFEVTPTLPGATVPYIAVSTTADGIVTWTILDTDTPSEGFGSVVVRMYVDGVERRSAVARTVIHASQLDGDTPPAEYSGWVANVVAAKDTAVAAKTAAQTAQAGAEAAQASAEAADTHATEIHDAFEAGVSEVVAAIEEQYPTELAAINTQLAAIQNEFETAVGSVTVDSEVVLSRDGETTLKDRLDKMPTTKNSYKLFNKSAIVSGKYINGGTGAEVTNASYGYYSLDVTADAYYFAVINTTGFASTAIGAYFDANGTYVSTMYLTSPCKYLANSAKTMYMFRAPTGVAKAKFNFLLTDIDNIIIYQDAGKIHNGLSIEDKWIGGKVLKKTQNLFVYNLLDDLIDLGKIGFAYISSSENIAGAVADFCMLAPLPCTDGEKYSVYLPLPAAYNSMTYVGIFLAENFTFLSPILKTEITGGMLTIPANAKYMCFYYNPATLSTSYIKRLYAPVNSVMVRQDCVYPSANSVLKGKKWAHLGDSIGWYNYWQPYVTNLLGLTHINCGLGSSCLAGAAGAVRPAFYEDSRLGLGTYSATLENTIETRTYSLVIPNNPDIVTICGGANDSIGGISVGTDAEFTKALASKDKTTYKGSYSYIIETLLAWKPTLRIKLITPYEIGSTQVTPVADFALATRDVGNYYGLEVIDWHAEAGINKVTFSALTMDNVHVNSGEGAKRLAEPVIAALGKMLLI